MTRSIFRRAVAQHRRSEQIFRQQGLPAVGGPEPPPHEFRPQPPEGQLYCAHCGQSVDFVDPDEVACPARESGK
jgi:hypothetical protein